VGEGVGDGGVGVHRGAAALQFGESVAAERVDEQFGGVPPVSTMTLRSVGTVRSGARGSAAREVVARGWMKVRVAPWMVAAASGSVSTRARAATVKVACRYGRWLTQWTSGMLRVANRAASAQSPSTAPARVNWVAFASQRDHPRVPKRVHHPVELAVTADERTHLQRQLPRERIHRRQRSELPLQPRRSHLKHPLGPAEVAQAMLTQIDEPHVVGHHVTGQIRVACEHTICPPCATASRRAARFTADPK
jgi:hypothetical protein